MIGLGLSLCGGCAVADEDESTHLPDYRSGHIRTYYPAARVKFRRMNNTSLNVAAYLKKTSTAADWDMQSTMCSFSCLVIARGSRFPSVTVGTVSYYNDQDGSANYLAYSTCHMQLCSRLFTTEGGNISTLHYSAADRPYSTSVQTWLNWSLPIYSSKTGYLRFEIRDMILRANVFGTQTSSTLPDFRYDADLVKTQSLRLFNAGNIELQFFHSYWRNRATRQAWLCIPMQSAGGKAALFESTSKQIIEDESLSAE